MSLVAAHATLDAQSEILGTRWSDLDLVHGWLHVRQQMGRDGQFKNLKTDAGRRSVPLPRHVVDVLREHRDEQLKLRANAIEWHEHDLVLCTATGRPIGERNAHRSWSRILERAASSTAGFITSGTRS